ncbi:MAG: Glu-tRNA(Gln) amidotransferase GatDE subunit E [Bacteroidetes bacterium HGW-Bacteroidetes-6]|jgi:glutamyl-tRNA(Gln) amidotransferase subunit E|nr:MAG: Glu-tRNA(Gln) amidotransferase GatDE subunit E [Bacteroidetes bacterium HGW-Bacteroidetes-6]
MRTEFDPRANYEKTKKETGYVPRREATQQTYDAIGFMSGLEVHQQLLTEKKLFCNCPAGQFHKSDNYDAEVVRHMRPTLSELGEYDGTALMEFKTRKEIIYRVKNETTCTYEVDDTPPFPINRDALDIAIKISLLSKLNIVGEVHITRKQYLDGSIPTGFQRTAIIGVEGEIPLKNKKVRLIQLSIEEDSCREISDIGHTRIYKTDRLGMPLIETVTYPDMVNPDEVKEACDYIRFLNRSTGLVRTGIGAGREDVNVSCKGGTRIEIKGVAHTRWIPELTHIECFRQWALLKVREKLKKVFPTPSTWAMNYENLDFDMFDITFEPLKVARDAGYKLIAVNLPGFRGILSHFTQPTKMFADEIAERLKVIACLEHPNMLHTEQFNGIITPVDLEIIAPMLGASDNDAQIILWGPAEDMKTALETIEERCRMAFEGIPNETRKSFADGSTIFERVLPGADRMYPDTDSAPIPLTDEEINELGKNLPNDVIERYHQLKKWDIAESTYTYIFKNNLFPVIESISSNTGIAPKWIGNLIGHRLKWVEGHYEKGSGFTYSVLENMLAYLQKNSYDLRLAFRMLPVVYQYPKMDLDSVLTSLRFKQAKTEEIVEKIHFLDEKFSTVAISDKPENRVNWIMGQLHGLARGNMNLTELYTIVKQKISHE